MFDSFFEGRLPAKVTPLQYDERIDMAETVVGLFVGLIFFVGGMFSLVRPADVRRWKARYNERFDPFYKKNTAWDGHEELVHFLYRLAGGVIAAIGFVILFGTLRRQ